ncbi:hypothetical protein NEDG_00289 [Nematocida displodere]|uniref:Uncharacterized protein n=1 Tax=Nematocida displodere TaxID=1805483 RepID=A0A177EIL9_9MICR|nr:hypothetical protein NEDG_00289 [Nematocida displodere]
MPRLSSMPRVKMPTVVDVTEKALDLLVESDALRGAFERWYHEYFTDALYAPGALGEGASRLLEAEVSERSVFGVLGAPETAPKTAPKPKASLGLSVLGLALGYNLGGIVPVQVSVGVSGEGKDVCLQAKMSEEEVRGCIAGFWARAVRERVEEPSRLKGILSLSRVLLGLEANPIERAFFLFLEGRYGQVVPLLSLMESSLLSSILLMLSERGSFPVSDISGGGFVDSLIYGLLLAGQLEASGREKNRQEEYIASIVLMQLECVREDSLRILLNFLVIDLIDQMGLTDKNILVLLVDTGDRLKKQGFLEFSLSFYERALCLVKGYLPTVISRSIQAQLLGRIVQVSTEQHRTTDRIGELLSTPAWVEQEGVVFSYLAFTRQRVTAVTDVRVSVKRRGSGYGSKKPEKPEKPEKPVHCFCDQAPSHTGPLHQARTRTQIRTRTQTRALTSVASVSYTTPNINPGEEVGSGQKVKIKINLPELALKPTSAKITIDGHARRLKLASTSARTSLYLTTKLTNTSGQRQKLAIERLLLNISGAKLLVRVDYHLYVLPAPYTYPKVKYIPWISAHGLTPMLTRGCSSSGKGVYISEKPGGEPGRYTVSYKASTLTRFFVRDCMNQTLRVRTKHQYTEEPKPKVLYHQRGSKVYLKVTGECSCLKRKLRLGNTSKIGNLAATSIFTPVSEDNPLVCGKGSSRIEEVLRSVLLLEPKPVRHSALSQAVRARFFRGDSLLSLIQKYVKKEVLPHMPVRVGLDPIAIISTCTNVLITRIPLERSVSSNPYSLWGTWAQVRSLGRSSLFEARVLDIERIHHLLTSTKEVEGEEVTTPPQPRLKVWYIEGCLVEGREEEGICPLTICNYSSVLSFVVMAGMKMLYINPHETMQATTEGALDGLCVSIGSIGSG